MWANEIAISRNKELQQKWIDKIDSFNRSNNRSELEELVSAYRNNQPCRVVDRFQGGFNYCFKLRFDGDGTEWILRFPIEGETMNPIAKVRDEVNIMRFIMENVNIAIPKVIESGLAEGKFQGLGPFMIEEFIYGDRLDERLFDEDDNLRPNIGHSILEYIYRQLARIYLLLSGPSFDKIGALHLDEAGGGRSWSVHSSPLTQKMNEVERMGGVVLKDQPGPFTSTTKYLKHLAQQSILHLRENQYSVDNETEARNEYVFLHALESTADHFAHQDGLCKLFCDDIRFGNILVDEDFRITALLDWEFCYSAPAQFLYSPPPWLVSKEPWNWDEDDEQEYKVKLGVYIRIMKEEEEASGKDHSFSSLMQQYMDDGTFWYNLAVRESFCLRKLMKRYGSLKGIKSVEAPDDLESFLKYKIGQIYHRVGATGQ